MSVGGPPVITIGDTPVSVPESPDPDTDGFLDPVLPIGEMANLPQIQEASYSGHYNLLTYDLATTTGSTLMQTYDHTKPPTLQIQACLLRSQLSPDTTCSSVTVIPV